MLQFCRLPWIVRGILGGLLGLAVGQFCVYLFFIWYSRSRRNIQSELYPGWDPLWMFTKSSYPLTRVGIINFLYIVILFGIGFILGVRCFPTDRQ